MADGIRKSVSPKDIREAAYLHVDSDEDTQLEKVGMSTIDKYFDLLVNVMLIHPGRAPARTLLQDAWRRVAPAYVSDALVSFL